jgi:uncharacterized protein YbjT (DUF2867 family)
VLASAGHDNRSYDLTGPQSLTYDQAADVLSATLGRAVRFAALSDADVPTGMLQRGLPAFHADALIEMSRAYRDGGADRLTTTVRDITGREPSSFAEFVADHRAAFGAADRGARRRL